MNFNELKVNSYGKLHNKDIKLENGINIIYGENEKGKTTLLNFIDNMLYGSSKLKKGKEISDYDKFKPWEGEDFSGRIKYTLDNGKKYEVFREFGKKGVKIYNEYMEDISKEYTSDKNSGSLYFFEQTNVDEDIFKSSVLSMQSEVEIDNQRQNILLQKIANTSSTGDENISYKKAIEKLNKKQLDEIGTNRSQGKPINIVINEMEELSKKNQELSKYKDYKYEIEDKKNKLSYELEIDKKNYEFLSELNSINQSQKNEKSRLEFCEKRIDNIESKIENLKEEKSNLIKNRNIEFNEQINNNQLGKNDKNNKSQTNNNDYILNSKYKQKNKIIMAIIIICLLIAIISAFINIKIAIIPMSIFIIALGSLIINNKKIKSNEVNKNNDILNNSTNEASTNGDNNENTFLYKIHEIDAQIQLLENSEAEQINEAEQIKNENLKKYFSQKELLNEKYSNILNKQYIENAINSDSVEKNIATVQNIINDKQIQLHKLEVDKKNIMPQVESIVENEEKLVHDKEIFNELKQKNDAINLAKKFIEDAYLKMKNDVTPRFTSNLSKNMATITDNKYTSVIINENDGILIELPNGDYKSINRLSKGTIEQLYLSFRLSIAQDISNESMPIILDEVFAYFDDNRLKNTINNIAIKYSSKHQIIIFTCTNREEMALQQCGLKYNKIEL